jgi:non-specific serine/threonine protein kinase
LVAGALAGLALLAVAGVPGHGAAPAASPARVGPGPCVSPAAVATFAAWPPAPPIADALADEAPAAPTPAIRDASGGPLTRREQEVAALVARGLTNRQIAARLVVTERTAGTHLERIMNKLGAHSRAKVAAWAVEHRLAGARAGAAWEGAG